MSNFVYTQWVRAQTQQAVRVKNVCQTSKKRQKLTHDIKSTMLSKFEKQIVSVNGNHNIKKMFIVFLNHWRQTCGKKRESVEEKENVKGDQVLWPHDRAAVHDIPTATMDFVFLGC